MVWLFDLDNTLHDSSRAIFKAIDRSMTTAVASTLNIDLDAASRIRTAYWRRYGATVIGMVRHHGIDARTFLRQIGRASGRDRVCQYVLISVVAVPFKKNTTPTTQLSTQRHTLT